MNSDALSSIQASELCVRAPKLFRILAAIYVSLLVAVGIMMWAKWGSGSWFLSLPIAVFPAIIYATAAFVYGRALFAKTGSAQSARAWLKLLWITAFLYSVMCAIVVVGDILPDEPGVTSVRPWAHHFVIAIAIALLVLWAYVGGTAFVRARSSSFHSRRALAPRLLGLLLLTGAFMMICSLALNVGYECTGWSVLRWQGAWVTNDFIEINALRTALNGLTLAGYAAGLILALLAISTGAVALARKSFPPNNSKNVPIVLNASIVVLWFTLTNYYFDCFYYAFIGPFNFGLEKGKFAIITTTWIVMFVSGIVLWLRCRNRDDDRGRTMRTVLILWYLPLMPAAIATFFLASNYELYGLILYVSGLQIVTACWWKMWTLKDLLVESAPDPEECVFEIPSGPRTT